jgi:hypothetical protein
MMSSAAPPTPLPGGDSHHLTQGSQIGLLVVCIISLLTMYINLHIFVRFWFMLKTSINRVLFALTMAEMIRLVVDLVLWALMVADIEIKPSTCDFAIVTTAATSTISTGYLGFYFIQILVVVAKHDDRARGIAHLFIALILVLGIVVGFVIGYTVPTQLDSTPNSPGKIACRTMFSQDYRAWIAPAIFQIIAMVAMISVVIKLVCSNTEQTPKRFWRYLTMRALHVAYYTACIVMISVANKLDSKPMFLIFLYGIYLNGVVLFVIFMVTEGPIRMIRRWWFRRSEVAAAVVAKPGEESAGYVVSRDSCEATPLVRPQVQQPSESGTFVTVRQTVEEVVDPDNRGDPLDARPNYWLTGSSLLSPEKRPSNFKPFSNVGNKQKKKNSGVSTGTAESKKPPGFVDRVNIQEETLSGLICSKHSLVPGASPEASPVTAAVGESLYFETDFVEPPQAPSVMPAVPQQPASQTTAPPSGGRRDSTRSSTASQPPVRESSRTTAAGTRDGERPSRDSVAHQP